MTPSVEQATSFQNNDTGANSWPSSQHTTSTSSTLAARVMPAVFQFLHKVITSTSSSMEPLNHVVTVALQALAPNNTKQADPERTTPQFTSNPAFSQYLSYVVQSSVHLWDNFACWFFLLCSHKHDTFLRITCESRSSTIKTVHRLLPLMSQEEGHCVCVENSSRVQVG